MSKRRGESCAQSLDREKRFKTQQTTCGSSDDSIGRNINFESTPDFPTSNPEAGPSVASCDDRSMGRLDEFKQHLEEEASCGLKAQTELDAVLKCLKDEMPLMINDELKKYHEALTTGSPEVTPNDEDDEQRRVKDQILNFTVRVLREKRMDRMADHLLTMFSGPSDEVCRHKLKSKLQNKFIHVFEGITKAGNPTLLNQIYTELYITEGGVPECRNQHDVAQIETTFRYKDDETITCEDIFIGSADRTTPIRTVLTKGVAGIGKTVLTQKFSLDWAEGKANQDIKFTFPFSFRELNLLQNKNISLVQLLHRFFPETKELCLFEAFKIVFIFDGLDEFRIPLDFNNAKILTDVDEAVSVDVLLVNLIRGTLLPSALLWITTRTAAANQIPAEYVSMVTEVRGFTDPQKEQYFRKRFREKRQATVIISHITTAQVLHMMCRIPIFCLITATVLDNVLKKGHEVLLPKTLTEMYIHFLVVQVKVKNVKYDGKAESDPHWIEENKKMVESLGKLAFEQLQKGNLIFYESDLKDCGIDVKAAAVYSGVFTQVFREEPGLYQDKVYCFIHLSVQEFLAALHVHHTFTETGVNLMSTLQTSEGPETEADFYQTAVDQALQSPNGHLDLFLRFLLGLSLSTNQSLLREYLKQKKGNSETRGRIIDYIKSKVNESSSTEKIINLFHCLNELNDRSLVEHIQQSINSGSLDSQSLSPAQWSALSFILLSSNKDLEMFDLRRYSASEEVLLRMLPVIKASTKAVLNVCSLSERSCLALSPVLRCPWTCLRELDLSNNILKDPRVELLFEGLKTLCPLQLLCLCNCRLSERSCEVLASLLTIPSSTLTRLDLTNNDLKDSGVTRLCDGLKSPDCKLETLRLSGCMVTEEGCSSLASALNSNPLHLNELDLSYNHLQDAGEKLLLARVEDPDFRLGTLRVEPGGARWMKPGLKKYSYRLRLDPTTVYRKLRICEEQTAVTRVEEVQGYPDHVDRFEKCPQVLCSQSLPDRCYWELDWSGWVDVSVCYSGIRRQGASDECVFGLNSKSWCLSCSDGQYSISYNKVGTPLPLSSVGSSGRIAVYLDCSGGSVSYYSVSGDELTLLHKFNSIFTEPLFAGIGLWASKSTATLCDL